MSRGTFTERPLGASSSAPPAPAPRTVTVIVPVLNGERLIEGCLKALDAQTLPPAVFEVVVVDDGSTDTTRDVVRRFAASARCAIRLVERKHAGPAAARNAGLAASASTIVAFTDADVEVAPDWLESAVRRLEADPTLAGVEGRTLPKGRTDTFTHQMHNERGGLYMTCNMIYRRDALAGGFDERFRMAFLEDSDVALGVLARGGRIQFAPEVLAHHLVLQEGTVKFWRDARKRFYNPLLYRKHPALYRRLLRPVVPAFPAPYIDYLLALAALAATIVAQAWVAVVPSGLLALWLLRRVAHVLRARTSGAIVRASLVPFVQTFWAVAGMIRFRSFDPRM